MAVTQQDMDRWLQNVPATRIGSPSPGGGHSLGPNPFLPTKGGGSVPPNDPSYVNKPGTIPNVWSTIFPLTDPGVAMRNALRQGGVQYNPFNQAVQRDINILSAGALPQFLSQYITGGAPADFSQAFGSFLQGLGTGQVAPWTFQQAQQGLGGINSLIRQVQEQVAQLAGTTGQAVDYSDPAAITKMVADMGSKGLLNQVQQAIAGMFMTPQAQSDLVMSALGPRMGGALAGGLAHATAPIEQAWSDYLQGATGRSGGMGTLLDLLLGSIGQGGQGPGTSGVGGFGSQAPGSPPDYLGGTGGVFASTTNPWLDLWLETLQQPRSSQKKTNKESGRFR